VRASGRLLVGQRTSRSDRYRCKQTTLTSTGLMQSARHHAVYNSRNLNMLIAPSRCPRAAFSLLLLLLCVRATGATDFRAPEQQLAEKIAAVTGPGAVSLQVINRSSLSREESDGFRRGLLTDLSALGVRFVNADQSSATVQVSLSEDLRNYVWIAEIHQSTNESSVVMITTPRPEAPAATQELSALTIRKSLLWTQDSRILDVAEVPGNPQHLIVLDPDNVTLYKFQNSSWQPEQTLAITHLHPWPRDLRGRLQLRKDHLFDAYLPGVYCRSAATSTLTLNCYESDDPWPLGTDQFPLNGFFSHTRNFFTGALAPGVGKQTTAPAFYSAAPLPRDKYALWLIIAIDGQLHMLDGITDQTAGQPGWGSDIASVHSGCGSGWQVLATGSSDSGADTARAFEIADREAVAVTQPAEFSGNITALWTESDGANVIAVARDLETGKYAAYRLTITCGQ
jgi:hypothetical protein